jgi:hypothetical protein
LRIGYHHAVWAFEFHHVVAAREPDSEVIAEAPDVARFSGYDLHVTESSARINAQSHSAARRKLLHLASQPM